VRWHWQAVLAAFLALLAVEGQPVAASYATSGPAAAAWRAVHLTQNAVTLPVRADASTTVGAVGGASAPATDVRPDFLVTFSHLDEAQAGQPFSYTLQVRNDGGTGGAVSVNSVLPPELSNVRVSAPGFVCTRRFSASGSQTGTLVACVRGDLESGGTADMTIEANAPATLGAFHLTAIADPRDEVSEIDEANNEADAMVEVHA
jgi:hypothetical protein